MPQYVLVLDAHAMDHIPDEDMPDVDKAAHAVSTGMRQEQLDRSRSSLQARIAWAPSRLIGYVVRS